MNDNKNKFLNLISILAKHDLSIVKHDRRISTWLSTSQSVAAKLYTKTKDLLFFFSFFGNYHYVTDQHRSREEKESIKHIARLM